MSVCTVIDEGEVKKFLENYELGVCDDIEPIQAGQTNSNYYLTLSHPKQTGVAKQFVLTIFENLSGEELQSYFEINNILFKANLPCACALKNSFGEVVQYIQKKPAVIAPRLPGSSIQMATVGHCRAVGVMLARMHIALAGVKINLNNPCDNGWYQSSISKLSSVISKEDHQLMQENYLFQQQQDYRGLPCGIIHSDLFRDNVLFQQGTLTGLLDFYYAYHDVCALDCATCVIDWCVTDAKTIDSVFERALCEGYESLRPFSGADRKLWDELLHRAAFRFWLARWMDRLKSLKTARYTTRDPDEMKAILLHINDRLKPLAL